MVPPSKLFAPKCPPYKGIDYPLAYVIHFKMAMALVSIREERKDSMFCKIFVSTFQDPTHKWFVEISPKSIINFNPLVKAFIMNYTYNNPI